MNDNIVFEKIWQDENLIELEIIGMSRFVKAHQCCYVDSIFLENIPNKITEYLREGDQECYLEFGRKKGNFSPAFSMRMLPANNTGHLKIEVDIEIADNDTRIHRCCFYVDTELGLIEKLGGKLKMISSAELGTTCTLNCID